ncbi:shikimate dehydrogenase [Glutamicibacter soli]|uniref:Shikimate dehydrogenase n=1 Tax=Glutamicibacter soli TaxID=453836 RepID=A0A365YG13_9MICC|nr:MULTISPECIES: shikimate dehydrogenase [Micrococcaceae]ALQ29709.1 shikimate dehydrogenase [Arthrobacter sp. YC-RL1]KLI88933.1 shikimate dehydrogenase [Arthrobacter sp. YC-RL1]RBM01651.1 shikimate dehydrogenase [Glutamicibacter soli]
MSTTAESYLVGLIGDGVMPSLTPGMHEREADAQGLRYLYRPIDLTVLERPGSDVGALLKAGEQLGFNAFNITHPCKQLVLEHLDEISQNARDIGAVNTVVIRDGKFHGYNTDASGFGRGFAEGLPGANQQQVLQLGAGGAGSAVAYALLASGTEQLFLVDPDAQRAGQRAAELNRLFPEATVTAASPDQVPELLPAADGLLNATPIGMHHHPGLPLDLAGLESRHWVADCIYRPVDTELILAARDRGCRVLDGGHMAVGQAVDSFEIFTGIKPDAARMRAHLLEMLEAGL